MSQFKKIEQDIRNRGEVRWKHAMHLLRLLLTGASTLRDARVPVRVEAHRERLLTVKRGEMSCRSSKRSSRISATAAKCAGSTPCTCCASCLQVPPLCGTPACPCASRHIANVCSRSNAVKCHVAVQKDRAGYPQPRRSALEARHAPVAPLAYRCLHSAGRPRARARRGTSRTFAH